MLKGAEAAAIKEQQKASEIMAERLPGLTDPNAPAANPVANPASGPVNVKALPGQNQAAPPAPPAPKLLRPQHQDRFTPGAAPSQNEGTVAPAGHENKPVPKPEPKRESQSGQKANPQPAHAGRNP
jgi:rod shape-determining protein MreC